MARQSHNRKKFRSFIHSSEWIHSIKVIEVATSITIQTETRLKFRW